MLRAFFLRSALSKRVWHCSRLSKKFLIQNWYLTPSASSPYLCASLQAGGQNRIGVGLVRCCYFADFLPSDSLPPLRQQIGGVPTQVGEGVNHQICKSTETDARGASLQFENLKFVIAALPHHSSLLTIKTPTSHYRPRVRCQGDRRRRDSSQPLSSE